MKLKEFRSRTLSGLFLLLTLSACQELKQGEYGVVYSDLPPVFGGGVKEKLVEPGEREVILPWETLYRFDTTRKALAWGGVGQGTSTATSDYVETRSLDGNEVDLAITVLYSVDPKMLHHVIQRVGTTEDGIRRLVAAVARADIRNHMNVLHTKDFFSPERRQAAVDQVKKSLRTRLAPEGIVVDDVIYNDHRFERRLADGVVDRSYQEQIDRTQAIHQETEQEEKKIATVVEQKRREFNDAQAQVNRILEQVEGTKRQAMLQGDAYLAAKKNEAEEIRATGNGEVEGLKKQIEALSGPGGKALLQLSLVRELISANPKFVLVNSAGEGKGGIDLNKIDTNEILRQAEIFVVSPEIQKEKSTGAPASSPAPVATPVLP